MKKLSKAEQDDIVEELLDTLDEGGDRHQEIYEEFYDRLDVDHKMQVDDASRRFADDAVGHPSWRSDE